MAVIHQDLNERISKNPENDYPVLITLKDETLPKALENKGKFILGHKIYSATMSGKEIQHLANQSQIEAIEPDVEMGML